MLNLIKENISPEQLEIIITNSRELVLNIITENGIGELLKIKSNSNNSLRKIATFLNKIKPEGLIIDENDKAKHCHKKGNLELFFKTTDINKTIKNILNSNPGIKPNEIMMVINHNNNCLDIYFTKNMEKFYTIKPMGIDTLLDTNTIYEKDSFPIACQ
jgi:hypothetical protein